MLWYIETAYNEKFLRSSEYHSKMYVTDDNIFAMIFLLDRISIPQWNREFSDIYITKYHTVYLLNIDSLKFGNDTLRALITFVLCTQTWVKQQIRDSLSR